MNNLKLAAFADESCPNINGQIDAMLRNQIGMLEIRNVDGTNISEITAKKAKEVLDKLKAANLSVWSIGSPFGKIDINDNFTPHLDLFKKSLENAKILDAKCIRLFSFFTKEFTPTVRDTVLERLNMFAEVSKGYDIILCHENEKGIYGDIAERCLEIYRAIPEIKGVFDPANFLQCGQDIKSGWEMLNDYIYYLHIKDVDSTGNIVPAGTGLGEIPYLAKEYSAKGGGVMTLEPHLKVFDGLAALENGEKTQIDDSGYKSNEEAFDAAAAAIKNIISAL